MSGSSASPEPELRPMGRGEWAEVAELIHCSTNHWYQTHGRGPIFGGGPEVAELFCEVYEALDPGCCLTARHPGNGRLMGSCFYHPRETHVSLGIMNVHPSYAGRGVAGRLLRFITDLADGRRLPVRLVSSALNLDSYSLYTRNGFVPRLAYQDMTLAVPPEGPGPAWDQGEVAGAVRPAVPADVAAMVELEREVSGIARGGDFAHFIENTAGIWHGSVLENGAGGLDGFLFSVAHPGSNMLGPGVARSEAAALALIRAELDANRGRSPVFLVPVEGGLPAELYRRGARNCEIHFAQVRGAAQPFKGVTMPTFMPETG